MAGSLSMATPEQTPDIDTVTTNTDFPNTPEGSDYESDDDNTGGWTMTTLAILILKKDENGNWTVREEPGVGAAVTQEVPKLKHKLKNKTLKKPNSS